MLTEDVIFCICASYLHFLVSSEVFLVTVFGHIWYSQLKSKNKNTPILQPKKRKKLSVSIRVCRFSKEGGRGGEAAAPVREEKSQQFGHDCILDPFRTRSANAT